jgi:hypothetical protein
MLKKFGRVALLSILTFVFAFLLSVSKVSAQTEPTPTPTPCLEVIGYETVWSDWEVAPDGLSRTSVGTTATYDYFNEQLFCGNVETTVTEYRYCYYDPQLEQYVSSWLTEEQIALMDDESAYYGYCEGEQTPGPSSTPEPTPDPTPLSCGADEHLNASSTQCVKYDMPGGGDQGGGTTSTGQVLGASTLAATGDGNSIMAVLAMILGLTLTATGAVYAFNKHS